MTEHDIKYVLNNCRPFTKSKGLPTIPKRLIPFTKNQSELHSKIIDLRHEIYAHSDGEKYEVKPAGDEVFHTSIFSSNFFMLSKRDLTTLQTMINKMIKSFWDEQQLLEYYLTVKIKKDKTGSA